jgi:predicted lipoprotein with Yx(FWY)xxD motif
MRLPAAIVVSIALALAGCGSSKPRPVASASPATTASTPTLTHAVKVPVHRRAVAQRKPKPHPRGQTKNTIKPKPTAIVAKAATTPKTAAAKPAAPPPGSAVDTGSSSIGTILVGANGRTLYLFKKDTGPSSSCYGACASVWPPYTTNGNPVSGSGVQASLLGTTKRSDGTTQVTYAGHPLYFFGGDTVRGSITGEGLKQFGARWWVVSPGGGAIKRG